MSKSRSKPGRVGHPRIMGPSVHANPGNPPSLPPADIEGALVPPSSIMGNCVHCGLIMRADRKKCTSCQTEQPTHEELEAPKPAWYLPDDSKVRRTSLLIMAMRMSGMEDGEIASALKISPKSIGPYIYRAGKNGWLNLDNPRERIEYQIMNKAVDNLEAMLEDETLVSEKKIKHEATMDVLKGTAFKQFDQQAQVQQPQQTIVAVKIEMPEGPPQQMRLDTIGGTPAYLDGEKL